MENTEVLNASFLYFKSSRICEISEYCKEEFVKLLKEKLGDNLIVLIEENDRKKIYLRLPDSYIEEEGNEQKIQDAIKIVKSILAKDIY